MYKVSQQRKIFCLVLKQNYFLVFYYKTLNNNVYLLYLSQTLVEYWISLLLLFANHFINSSIKLYLVTPYYISYVNFMK